ncbi:hypothetical protein L6164_023979 [Bauhinia variegata]|uniref:Uncharacterized protein n=1 Tax=Bauhinia variegata TaxID=167791 RepID=A0ACB9LXC7_BAUVA|nr:hypothetical protein L6164_023979 [Bauhinia variegata]
MELWKNSSTDRAAVSQNQEIFCGKGSIILGLNHSIDTAVAVTLYSLIDCLGWFDRVNDAYRLYVKMLNSNWIPNAVVYTFLLRNFFKGEARRMVIKITKR